MNPAATAVSDEHVVMLADQRDLTSLLPSTGRPSATPSLFAATAACVGCAMAQKTEGGAKIVAENAYINI
jgi:hypothetical protein